MTEQLNCRYIVPTDAENIVVVAMEEGEWERNGLGVLD